MSSLAWLGVTVVVASLFLVLGMVFGVAAERRGWQTKGREFARGGTAHHCEGEFFYIIPEHVFVTKYAARPYSSQRPPPAAPEPQETP